MNQNNEIKTLLDTIKLKLRDLYNYIEAEKKFSLPIKVEEIYKIITLCINKNEDVELFNRVEKKCGELFRELDILSQLFKHKDFKLSSKKDEQDIRNLFNIEIPKINKIIEEIESKMQ